MKPFQDGIRKRLRLFRSLRRNSKPEKLQHRAQDLANAMLDDQRTSQSPANASPVSVDGGVAIVASEEVRLDRTSSKSTHLTQNPAGNDVAGMGGDRADSPMFSPVSTASWTDDGEYLARSEPEAADAGDHSDATGGLDYDDTNTPDFEHTYAESVAEERAIPTNARYLEFDGEDETDYTTGPARMVHASDGLNDRCAALLMTLDLSGKMQRAIRAQRDYEACERRSKREKEVLRKFAWDLDLQILNQQSRAAAARKQNDEEQVAALEEEKEVLEAMLRNNQYSLQCVDKSLQWQAKMLCEIQADVNAYLEDALMDAQLLEPADEPEPPMEELDLQKEYQEFRKGMREEAEQYDHYDDVACDPPTPPPLKMGIDHLKVQLDPEQQTRLEVWTIYREMEERLQEAQAAFDRKEDDRAWEQQANYEAAQRGEETMDASQEDFDLRWLKRYQELTHELIEAEAALSQAKADMVAAGKFVGDCYQASGFADDVDDGYRISSEEEAIAAAPEHRILSWLGDVPANVNPDHGDEVETDEWETQTLAMGDSISVVAEGSDRRRINKWRKLCGL